MPINKVDPKVIFASNAPAIDKPPVFSDKTKGWDVARANDGRPTIKEMNKIQQDTDLKILWLNENSVTPYDESIDYPDGVVSIKDGSFKQLVSGSWVEFLDDFANKDEVKRGIANRYDSSLTYSSGERVILTNGDIVKSAIDGNTNNPNVDMTGWVLSGNTITVESIADLTNIRNPKDGMVVTVGGSDFKYDSAKISENNGGTIFNGWVRQYDGNVYMEWFGAVGDGVTDDSEAINACILFAFNNNVKKISCNSGSNFGVSKQISIPYRGVYRDYWLSLDIDFSGTRITVLSDFSSDDNVVFKVERDFAEINRPIFDNSINNIPNLTAFAFAPDSLSENNTARSQQFNTLSSPLIIGFDYGVKSIMGASNGETTAGSYYNTVINPTFLGVTCAIWLAGNELAINNLNTRFTVYNPKHVMGNCTFLLESFDTFTCIGGSSEFINRGTFPCITPTVIRTKNKAFPSQQWSNSGASFHRFGAEACTQMYYLETDDVSFIDCFNIFVDTMCPQESWQPKTSIQGEVLITSNTSSDAGITVKAKSNNIFLGSVGDGTRSVLNSSKPLDITANITECNSVVGIGGSLTLKSNWDVELDTFLKVSASGSRLNLTNTTTVTGGEVGFLGVTRILASGVDLGSSSEKFNNLYLTNAPVISSDANYKDNIRSISEIEKMVAQELRNNIRAYNLIGDDNSIHVGVIAQDVIDIFSKYNLDAIRYKMVDFDGDRYGIRYEQLIMFILSA